MIPKDTLIVMALPAESQGRLEQLGYDVIYTGIGKVNAAYVLARKLHEALRQDKTIPLVLNLGSAGSPRFNTGALVAAHRFVQRDMDATGLGFAHGETPFDAHPVTLEFAPRFTHLEQGVCGSGDSFLQGLPPIECDVIDMEAYALAKICHIEAIPFACAKYITDGADHKAHDDWRENLRFAADAFVSLLKPSEVFSKKRMG